VISSDGGASGSGSRERTDQVGFESRASMSTRSLRGGSELYLRVEAVKVRFWTRMMLWSEARQRAHINPDISNLAFGHSDSQLSSLRHLCNFRLMMKLRNGAKVSEAAVGDCVRARLGVTYWNPFGHMSNSKLNHNVNSYILNRYPVA